MEITEGKNMQKEEMQKHNLSQESEYLADIEVFCIECGQIKCSCCECQSICHECGYAVCEDCINKLGLEINDCGGLDKCPKCEEMME